MKLYLDIHDKTGAVATDYLLVNSKEETIEIASSKSDPIACGIMFRKEHLSEIGLYNDDFKCMEEKELMIRFKQKFKLDHLNLPLYRYRKHATNMTNNKLTLKKYEIIKSSS